MAYPRSEYDNNYSQNRSKLIKSWSEFSKNLFRNCSEEGNLFLRLFFKLRLVCEAVHLEFRALAPGDLNLLNTVKYHGIAL